MSSLLPFRYAALRDFCADHAVSFGQTESMARHTSLRIGGPADIVISPGRQSIGPLIAFLRQQEIPFVIVGRGTNILVRDSGIEGVVVFTEGLGGLEASSEGDDLVAVGSGCLLSSLMAVSIQRGLSGIEGLVGIPGSIGGAVSGNAGSFGYEIRDRLLSVALVDMDGACVTLRRDEIPFAYRSAGLPPQCTIIGAEFRLIRDEPAEIRRRIGSFMREKSSRQPVTSWSAGCVFRNPEGISAGRLIDEAGCKGMRAGGIEVSRLHANYFINTGRGKASDFLELMERVALQVAGRSGISLEPEVRIIGRA